MVGVRSALALPMPCSKKARLLSGHAHALLMPVCVVLRVAEHFGVLVNSAESASAANVLMCQMDFRGAKKIAVRAGAGATPLRPCACAARRPCAPGSLRPCAPVAVALRPCARAPARLCTYAFVLLCSCTGVPVVVAFAVPVACGRGPWRRRADPGVVPVAVLFARG